MVLKDERFKSCERVYTIDFSLSLEIKSMSFVTKPDEAEVHLGESDVNRYCRIFCKLTN